MRRWRARNETTPHSLRACIYCEISVPAGRLDTTNEYHEQADFRKRPLNLRVRKIAVAFPDS